MINKVIYLIISIQYKREIIDIIIDFLYHQNVQWGYNKFFL